MITRRDFLVSGSLAALGAGIGMKSNLFAMAAGQDKPSFISKRPPAKDRTFVSEAVDALVEKVKAEIHDPELAWLFENCFPNTLDTAIKHHSTAGKPDTFVITGDIDAMWLRDSTAEVWPYIPLVKKDKKLALLIEGVINRHTNSVLIDPYANAFLFGDEKSEHAADVTEMKPGVFERKWEIDSLCYVVRLGYQYWKVSGSTAPYDTDWLKAMKLIVKTFREQQRKTGNGPYTFFRGNDSVPSGGIGNPVHPNGLICSVFRPSDDGTIFPFLIPSNFFAVASLRQMAEMARTMHDDKSFAAECIALADEVNAALDKHAIVDHPEFGKIYAYEIDGFGGVLLMDDANIPSLLSLPYIAGIAVDSPVYQHTRKMVLSKHNPYFAEGKFSGVGGPHTGVGTIWPLSYVMRAMTSKDSTEITHCLQMIKETHAGTGFVHESFDRDDPKKYTRSWFAWANTIFGELILKLRDEGKL